MLVAAAFAVFALMPLARAGSWSAVGSTAPGSVQLMILLTDGTVMCCDGGNGNWWKLTPDTSGNYANGSWSTLASMHYTRRYFSSQVLQNGKVMVAGGEYGTGGATSEIYDPVANTWTTVSVPSGLLYTGSSGDAENSAFRDSESILIANGTMMVAPVFPYNANQTVIYDPVANTWSGGAYYLRSQNEACWAKLPDDSILTIDKNSTQSERYIPSSNTWINDNTVSANLYGAGAEIGPGLLCSDGRVFYLGGNNNTAFYTPSGSTSMGSWAPGPGFPNSQGCPDAPAAMLPSGNIFFTSSALGNANNAFPTNVSFYEFNPSSSTYTRQNSPTGGLTHNNIATYNTALLVLPSGNVLYSSESSQVYVYNPGESALASGKPTISRVSWNTDGSVHVVGTLLNGISAGSAYGDDEQNDSNYPLLRFTDGSGNVTYGRSYNWSSTSVKTGGRVLTTEASLPSGVFNYPGTYSLQVVANGNASDAVTFYGPVWVDFNYTSAFNFYFGWYVYPYNTLATGVSGVTSGGTIVIKSSNSHETMTISKPMTITSVYGPSTVGH